MAQDVFAEQEALKRRRALLDAMQAQNLNQPIVGDTGLGQALAKLGTAAILKRGQARADDESVVNKERYNQELAGALQQYLNKREGTAGTPANEMGDEAVPGTPADKRGAILQAMTSRFPELQGIGKAEFGLLGKQSGYKEHVIDGRLVRSPEDGGKPSVVGDFADQYSEPYSIPSSNGNILVRKNLRTQKVEPIDSGTKVTTNVDARPGAKFGEKLGEEKAKLIAKSREDAVAAAKAIEALENADIDVQNGIKTGAAANVQLGIAKWAKALGLGEADPQIANTEAFRANMARETLNLVKGLGAGTAISNADREFAEKASGGSITLDDAAMIRLMDIARAAAANVQMKHKDLLSSAARSSGGDAEDLAVFEVPFSMRSERVVYDPELKRFVVRGAAPTASTAPAAPGASSPGSVPGQPKRKLDGRITFGGG